MYNCTCIHYTYIYFHLCIIFTIYMHSVLRRKHSKYLAYVFHPCSSAHIDVSFQCGCHHVSYHYFRDCQSPPSLPQFHANKSVISFVTVVWKAGLESAWGFVSANIIVLGICCCHPGELWSTAITNRFPVITSWSCAGANKRRDIFDKPLLSAGCNHNETILSNIA